MTERMYIPRLGDQFTLASDWTFLLHNEKRNKHFFLPKEEWDTYRHYFFGGRESTILSENWEERKIILSEFVHIEEVMVDGVMVEGLSKPFGLVENHITFRPDYGNFVSKKFLRKSDKQLIQFKYPSRVGYEMFYEVTYLQRVPFPDRKETLPAGTLLQVDRIYVRRGRKDYDSVTFTIKNGPKKGYKFWASLDDTRYMELKDE